MKFRDLFIAFVLIGIFILCMVNFGTQIANANNSTYTILTDPVTNLNESFGELETNLSTFRSKSASQRDNVEGESPKVGAGFFMLDTILGALRTFNSMIIGVFNLFLVPMATILGIDEAIIGLIFTILIISMILLFWRVVKAGE